MLKDHANLAAITFTLTQLRALSGIIGHRLPGEATKQLLCQPP